jgi:hypothetical protein
MKNGKVEYKKTIIIENRICLVGWRKSLIGLRKGFAGKESILEQKFENCGLNVNK